MLLLLLALALVRFTKKEWRPGNVFVVGWDMLCFVLIGVKGLLVLCFVLWGRRQITCDDAALLAEGARDERRRRGQAAAARH